MASSEKSIAWHRELAECAGEMCHVVNSIGKVGREGNFDIDCACTRADYSSLCRDFGGSPKSDIDNVFRQRGEVRCEGDNLGGYLSDLITRRDRHGVEESWKAGLYLKIGYAQRGCAKSSWNMAEGKVGVGGVGTSNIHGFVLEGFDKTTVRASNE
jgi:hypothetical protein